MENNGKLHCIDILFFPIFPFVGRNPLERFFSLLQSHQHRNENINVIKWNLCSEAFVKLPNESTFTNRTISATENCELVFHIFFSVQLNFLLLFWLTPSVRLLCHAKSLHEDLPVLKWLVTFTVVWYDSIQTSIAQLRNDVYIKITERSVAQFTIFRMQVNMSCCWCVVVTLKGQKQLSSAQCRFCKNKRNESVEISRVNDSLDIDRMSLDKNWDWNINEKKEKNWE